MEERINIRTAFHAVLLVAVVTLVCACAPIKLPKRFATVTEVFPEPPVKSVPADVPPDSVKKGIFGAAFDDVFQAVKVGATQAQFNIEHIDGDKGVILATRTLRIRNVGGHKNEATRVFSYAILTRELGPESTEVVVLAKLQDSCIRSSAGTWAGVSCLTLGIAAPTACIAIPLEKKQCEEASTVRWAADSENSLQEMSQLLTFTRNNLIAAGVI